LPHEVEIILVLVDIEDQRDRRYDRVDVVLDPDCFWLVNLLEVLLRGPDLREIQREHEPLKIPRIR